MASTTRTKVPAATTPTKRSTKTAIDALAADAPAGITDVALDLIDEHPRNPRRDLGELEELADSIRTQGVLQNVTLVPNPDAPGRFLALLGHRRIAAARLAGLTSLPAGVRADLDAAEQVSLMLVENLQRSDLTAFEEGRSYQGLLDLGLTQADIVTRTGRARSTVAARVKLSSLDERAEGVYHAQHLTLDQAMELADLKESNEAAYETLWRLVEERGSFRSWMVKEAAQYEKAARDAAVAAAEAAEAGLRVLDAYPQGEGRGEPVQLLWRLPHVNGAEHETSCPEHAVFFEGTYHSYRRIAFCMQALELHPVPQAVTKEKQEADTEQARINAALVEVGPRRTEWLVSLYSVDSPENLATRKQATAVLAEAVARQDDAVSMDGVELPEIEDASGAAILLVPESAVDTITLALLWSLVRGSSFPRLYPWSFAVNYVGADLVQELELFQACGYSPHEIELEFAAAVADAASESAEG